MGFGAFCPMPLRLGGSSLEGLTPEQHARICADVVAAKRTVPVAVLTYTKSGGTITLHNYTGMNGRGLAYAPTATSISTGRTGFSWSGIFEDPYEITYPINLQHGVACVHGATGIIAIVTIGGTYAFEVRTISHAGTATDCKVTVALS
jgi:hypothetical protein